MKNRLDVFGVLIIAFATAIGGGTIRDILLEGRSVFWLTDASYLYFIIAGTIVAIVLKSQMAKMSKPLLVFDAIGLGLFTITGVQIGMEAGLGFIICLILGTITGAFGGVVRDIFVNEVPVIFKKEIYATISLLGGALYIFLVRQEIAPPYLQLIPILFMIITRLLVIYFRISLPSIYRKEKNNSNK